MLMLTRKSDERILIGDGIELLVLSIQGNRVRLGIQAPAEVSIARMTDSPDLVPGTMPTGSNAQQFCPAT